jgi:hypothetical protein
VSSAETASTNDLTSTISSFLLLLLASISLDKQLVELFDYLSEERGFGCRSVVGLGLRFDLAAGVDRVWAWVAGLGLEGDG